MGRPRAADGVYRYYLPVCSTITTTKQGTYELTYSFVSVNSARLHLGTLGVTGDTIHSPITVSNISSSFSHTCDYVPKERPTGSNLIELPFYLVLNSKGYLLMYLF